MSEEPTEGLKAIQSVIDLPMDVILPPETPTRLTYSEEAMKALIRSVRKHGVRDPITVRPKGTQYEIVKGHHRFMASKAAKKKTIPALIKDLIDEDALLFSLVENLYHEDLDPISEAAVYHKMKEDFGLKDREIAGRVNLGVDRVRKRLKLLELPEDTARLVMEGKLAPSTAHELFPLKDEKLIEEVGAEAAHRDWSQAVTRNYVKGILTGEEAKDEIAEAQKEVADTPAPPPEERQCFIDGDFHPKSKVQVRQICADCEGIFIQFVKALRAGAIDQEFLVKILSEDYEAVASTKVYEGAAPDGGDLTEAEITAIAEDAEDLFDQSPEV
jgi:ParB family chromosome partitioning protein